MNKAAALGKALDALEAFDESLWEANFDIDEGVDSVQFLRDLAKRMKTSDSALTALFDVLEKRLNAALAEETQAYAKRPFKNPRRRR